MNNDEILHAALEILPLLPSLLGDDAPRMASKLRALLNRTTRKPSDKISESILTLLTTDERTRVWMEARISVGSVRKGSGARPVQPASSAATDNAMYQVVQVMFATDRQPAEHDGRLRMFGGERGGSIAYGTCDVSVPVPPVHLKGRLESPSWWRLEFRPDRSRHVVLLDVTTLGSSNFFDLANKRSDECLLFVHGYNVTFADAARRLGQITCDLQFTGLPLLYSWPSCGKPFGYTLDEATIDWTAPHLLTFLQDLIAKTNVRKVNVVAHSMGSRIVLHALHYLAQRPPEYISLNQIVLTAPDVDAQVFEQMVPEFLPMATRVTLYASADDMALVLSRNFHGFRRAGDTKEGVVIVQGMDSIDVTGADSSFLGHSYFGSVRTIISDLFYLLRGIEAAERSDLREVLVPAGKYYRYSM